MMTADLHGMADEAFCYLTTIGRVSGRQHTIEIWFALNGQTLYMLSGGMDQADWVKNGQRRSNVTIRIKQTMFNGQMRLVSDPAEDTLARQLVGEKYRKTEEDLDEWLQTALAVAVDLLVPEK